MHHSLADGIALIMFFSNLCDNPRLEDLPPITIRFSILQKLGQLIMIPQVIIVLLIKVLFVLPIELNGIKTEKVKESLTDKKKAAFCPSISTNLIKARAKTLGCTLNDILITCISRSIK